MLVQDGADGVLIKEHFALSSKGGNFDKDCYKNFSLCWKEIGICLK